MKDKTNITTTDEQNYNILNIKSQAKNKVLQFMEFWRKIIGLYNELEEEGVKNAI